jgi:hypothetical protein
VEPTGALAAASRIAPWLSFRFSEGHTPGLMLSELSIDGKRLLYASDLVPGAPWVSASLSMGYDRFAELVLDEKRKLLTEYAQGGHALFFTHDPEHDCGVVAWDETSAKFRCQGSGLAQWLAS